MYPSTASGPQRYCEAVMCPYRQGRLQYILFFIMITDTKLYKIFVFVQKKPPPKIVSKHVEICYAYVYMPFFIKSLTEYKEAIENDDASTLRTLLSDGKKCKEEIPVVACGIFGADMKISLLNDGPFTIILDSDEIC